MENKNIKLSDKLINDVSKEIKSNQQKRTLKILDKVSENQEVEPKTLKNIFGALEDNANVQEDDDNSSVDSSITDIQGDEKYDMTYKILKKIYQN